jgi:hypothetical protein
LEALHTESKKMQQSTAWPQAPPVVESAHAEQVPWTQWPEQQSVFLPHL